MTFGVGERDRIERLVVEWPSGATQEFKSLVTGKGYQLTENKDIIAMTGF